jgi:hypothetical protein
MAVSAHLPAVIEDDDGRPPVVQPGARPQLRAAAAQLYGRGMKRADVARNMAPYMRAPGFADNPFHPESLKYVRKILRGWERDAMFRDEVYASTLAELDLQVPDILEGVARQGKRGRVDAARLVLEVTGRHNPKGDQTPTNITIQIANVPRPE